MIKDIVVNLSVGQREGCARDYAVSVANALKAHITAIAFVYDPLDLISQLGYVATDVMKEQWRDYNGEAQAVLDRFMEVASRTGVSAEPLMLNTSFASASDRFGIIARRFDLVVVGQAEPDQKGGEETIIESPLFDSGRPVIIVPHTQSASLKLDHVMICWDSSRPAVRAIADAMPLLELAGRVEVVVVDNERGKHDEPQGADMGRHLARHGVNLEVKRITRGEIDVANTLLSHAADSGTDLVVMGGYGHSRLREFVLGGVTHSMLRFMTVPVLMSH